MPLATRMFSRLIIRPAPMDTDRLGRPIIGPCLVWNGPTRNGYASVWDPDRGASGGNVRVHRAMFEMFVGPITEQVDHLCRVRNCASPAHLEDVFAFENTARADRFKPSEVFTHCKRGHALTPENARFEQRRYGTARVCRKCDNEKNRRLYRERKSREGKVVNAPRTACSKGHLLDEANTYINPKGYRVCRECVRIANREWQARKRSEQSMASPG